ncbi:hypothetical protein FQA39_LY09318 [Lamprigera yunnana]|nr:hypothetical protein FQA39_LY09318 [Lamprigera yunnana]
MCRICISILTCNVASTSTSSVTVTPKRSFATVFNDVIFWPHHTPTVGKRKKEYTLSFITSERWVEYYELKEKEMKMKEDLKAEKKKRGNFRKTMGKKPQVSKRKKKKPPLSSEDEDEEEWIEIHYKYVAKILQVLEGDDFEVQCLKNLDETKTTFKFIENDQCVIAKKEILGRLPDPQLVQFGRILKTVFPAEVEVYEKS